jgi:hypothetical protein
MGRQIFEPLTAAEVKSLIPTYHDLYRDAKPAVLAMIDGARCHGRIGFWAAFTYAATIRARGRTTMTQPFAQELLRGDP